MTHFRLREPLYRAAVADVRVLQLIQAFPLLAVRIFSDCNDDVVVNEAVALVRRGAPLRRIADLIGVPMALRKVKPGAAFVGLRAIRDRQFDPRLIDAYMPESLPRMKVWLHSIAVASNLGSEFVVWIAKHVFEIGGTIEGIHNIVVDISDWVRACQQAREGSLVLDQPCANRGEQFVTRSFSPDMALRTVLKLSDEWHEAVASI